MDDHLVIVCVTFSCGCSYVIIVVVSLLKSAEVEITLARTTRLNKVIFDQMLSNFGPTATFRAKLSMLITAAT